MLELLLLPIKIKATVSPSAMPTYLPVQTVNPRFFAAAGGAMFFFSLLAFAYFVFWVWSLVSVLSNKRLDGTNKILWFLVIVVLPVLGPILYYFLGYKKK